ncbi:hypothetical protein EXE58_13125 [Nocardioides seonyuensis]|uniref:phospholipase D n=1 Tax=Nocardioides seonyuensis TaxID=2518371 RepID=A0A4P7IJ68_9ACTN|nr:phospholipase D-like domain-containing protein [Nocardioides seonyuensis]QBX56317.1 hypothetical protein EXE58_13125 [Nocardioides seonyuensis]
MSRWLLATLVALAGLVPVHTTAHAAAHAPRASGTSGCFTAPDGATEACFNDPRPGRPDDAVTRGLMAHVARAGAGDSIRISMFRWDDQLAAQAVIDAQRRGARVEVVADEDVQTKPAGRRVLEKIEAGEPGHQNVVVCRGACMPWAGPGPAPTAQDINHHKLYLFDIAGERSVAVTSSNLERRMHGQVNSMVRSTEPALWRFHTDYFERLRSQGWQGWSEKSRSVRGESIDAFVYPRRRDPVVALLDDVRCDARARTVDVLWAVIQRADVRRSLQELHGRGCRVRVVTTRDLIENWLEVRQTRRGRVLDLPDNRVKTHLVHDKLVLVHARVRGRVRRLTITGNSNATCGGLAYNDEVMWQIEDRWVHETMQRHFDRVFRRAHQGRTAVVPVQAPCR